MMCSNEVMASAYWPILTNTVPIFCRIFSLKGRGEADCVSVARRGGEGKEGGRDGVGEMREKGGERRGGRKGRERGRGGRFGRVGKDWREEMGETHRTPLCESCIWSRAMRYILIA